MGILTDDMQRLVREMRLGYTATGLVRAGCACYTTEDEVDRLIAGIETAL